MDVDARLDQLVGELDLKQKVDLLTGQDSWSLHAVPAIGLRSIVMSDGPVGVRGATWDERSPSVNFPSPTAVASSWDRALVRRIGEGLGREARRKGVDVVLAPTINLHRTPYGGRHFEAFSEDPLLTGSLARTYVEGIQSQGVGATVKHYVANDSETDRFHVDVRVDERTLRELYLLAFEEPIVAGRSWLVMSAYNSINGATASENPLLHTPLNDEWGFDGVVVSDWTAVRSVNSARYPQDLAMPGPDGAWGPALLAAVERGNISEATIDRKVKRILRLAARVGALEGFEPIKPAGSDGDTRRVALEGAIRGSVLLSNNGILPLASPAKIAVIGEGAGWARTQGGGSATVIPESVRSPFDAVRERWPDAEVTWSRGAVVGRAIADLEPSTFTHEGEPGMLVRYLDESGNEIAHEVRKASGIVSFDAAALASRSTTVEMSFRYSPDGVGSTVPFAVAGVSDWEVEADGARVQSGQLRTRPGDDPATAVLTPPWTSLELPIAEGTAAVTVRFRPAATEIPDAIALRVGRPPLDADPASLIAEAAKAAAAADVAIVVVSTSAEVESEGFDRTTLELPGAQDDLVREVLRANPRTILVVNSGAPVLLPWAEDAAAVLAVWFPGQEFGHGLAAVLSGDAEPGGRLPVSWPSREADVPVSEVVPSDGKLHYREGLHIGYRGWLRSGKAPAYPFGWGLGYTSWALESATVDTSTTGITATVRVANRGGRDGRTVVQVYADRAVSAVERPATWLVGFESIEAAAGESATAKIDVPWRHLAHWDDGWHLEPGTFRLRTALHVEDAGLSLEVEAPAVFE